MAVRAAKTKTEKAQKIKTGAAGLKEMEKRNAIETQNRNEHLYKMATDENYRTTTLRKRQVAESTYSNELNRRKAQKERRKQRQESVASQVQEWARKVRSSTSAEDYADLLEQGNKLASSISESRGSLNQSTYNIAREILQRGQKELEYRQKTGSGAKSTQPDYSQMYKNSLPSTKQARQIADSLSTESGRREQQQGKNNGSQQATTTTSGAGFGLYNPALEGGIRNAQQSAQSTSGAGYGLYNDAVKNQKIDDTVTRARASQGSERGAGFGMYNSGLNRDLTQNNSRPESYTSDNIDANWDRVVQLATKESLTAAEKKEVKEIYKAMTDGSSTIDFFKAGKDTSWYRKNISDPEKVQIYNLINSKRQGTIGAISESFAEGIGLRSIGEVAQEAITKDATDEYLQKIKEASDKYDYGDIMARYNANEHALASGAGNLAGNLALMGAIGAATSGLGPVLSPALATGGATAIQLAGDYASGDISGEDYLKSIGISTLTGAAGGAAGKFASRGVTSAASKFFAKHPELYENATAKTITAAINSGTSGAAFAAAATGLGEAANYASDPEGYNFDLGEYAKDVGIMFAYGAISGATKGFTSSVKENTESIIKPKTEYFKDCTTVEEVRKRQRDLQKQYHPDVGGDANISAQINAEAEAMSAYLSIFASKTAETKMRKAKQEGNTKAYEEAKKDYVVAAEEIKTAVKNSGAQNADEIVAVIDAAVKDIDAGTQITPANIDAPAAIQEQVAEAQAVEAQTPTIYNGDKSVEKTQQDRQLVSSIADNFRAAGSTDAATIMEAMYSDALDAIPYAEGMQEAYDAGYENVEAPDIKYMSEAAVQAMYTAGKAARARTAKAAPTAAQAEATTSATTAQETKPVATTKTKQSVKQTQTTATTPTTQTEATHDDGWWSMWTEPRTAESGSVEAPIATTAPTTTGITTPTTTGAKTGTVTKSVKTETNPVRETAPVAPQSTQADETDTVQTATPAEVVSQSPSVLGSTGATASEQAEWKQEIRDNINYDKAKAGIAKDGFILFQLSSQGVMKVGKAGAELKFPELKKNKSATPEDYAAKYEMGTGEKCIAVTSEEELNELYSLDPEETEPTAEQPTAEVTEPEETMGPEETAEHPEETTPAPAETTDTTTEVSSEKAKTKKDKKAEQTDIKNMTDEEMDAEYLHLAKAPKKNKKRLDALVREAAIRNGYDSPKLYRGGKHVHSPDADISKHYPYVGIYTSTRERVAAEFVDPIAKEAKVKEIGKPWTPWTEEQVKKSTPAQIAKRLSERTGEKWVVITSEEQLDKFLKNNAKADYITDAEDVAREWLSKDGVAYVTAEGGTHGNEAEVLSEYEVIPYLNATKRSLKATSGIQELYMKTENFGVIDAKGNYWRTVPYEGEIKTTDEWCEEFKDEGYTGLIIKNVQEGSGEAGKADDYITFDGGLIKSADTVTYDDSGKIIPLSKRFDDSKQDLRYKKTEGTKNKNALDSYDPKLINNWKNGAENSNQAFIKNKNAIGTGTPNIAEWTTTTTEGNTTEVKSLSEIIAKARHELGFNYTIGHIQGKNVLGQFNRRDKGVRTKKANDLLTFIHEAGHAIDERYKITRNPKEIPQGAKDELDSLLSQEVKAQYPQNQWLSEGMAEYIKEYLRNKDVAIAKYPEFTKHLMSKLNEADQDMLFTFADEVNAYLSKGHETATDAIRFQGETYDFRTPKEKFTDKNDEFRMKWVDSMQGVKRFTRASQDNKAYVMAINSAYSDNRAGDIIFHELRTPDGRYVAPGFRSCFEGINTGNKEEMRLFNEYLVVMHGPERLALGKAVFADDVQNTKEWMINRQQELEAEHPEFREAAEKVWAFVDEYTKTYAVDTGLLKPEIYKKWKQVYKMYVPFQRVMDDKGLKPMGARRGFANQTSPDKRAKGSGRDIYDPVTSIIDMVIKTTNSAIRNSVFQEITRAAHHYGVSAELLEAIPQESNAHRIYMAAYKQQIKDAAQNLNLDANGRTILDEALTAVDDVVVQYDVGRPHDNIVTVMENGEPQFYKVNDPLLLESIANFTPPQMEGILAGYAKTSRFITSNLTGANILWSFFSNAPRDFMTFLTFFNDKKHLLEAVAAIPRAYTNTFKEYWGKGQVNPIYREYMGMGGGNTTVYTADISAKKKITKRFNQTTTQRILRNLNPMNLVEWVANMIEKGPRFATYYTLRTHGMSAEEAFYEAMDVTTNFRRSGTMGKKVNSVAIFFNAGVQGVDKFARWISAEDVRNTKYRKKAARNRTIMFMAASAALAGIFYAMNNGTDEDKENYQALSAYTKNNFWVIPLGDGQYFTVPKPRELAVAESFFESVLERTEGGNTHAFDDFYEYFTDNFLPPVAAEIAQLPSGVIEDGLDEGLSNTISDVLGDFGLIGVAANVAANRDFLGRPIESTSLQNVLPKDRYTNSTSIMAKAIGEVTGYSPQKADYWGKNLLGSWWKIPTALFPVGESERDITLGIKNSYVKDNLYSTDRVNWMYEVSDKLTMESNSDEENKEKKIAAAEASNISSFYGKFNKLNKDNDSTEIKRATRKAVLDMVYEYQKYYENGKRDAAQTKLYESIPDAGSVSSYMPAVMSTTIQGYSGTEKVSYQLNDQQYYEYQTIYNSYYWAAVSKASSIDAEKIATIKKEAKNTATNDMLKLFGTGITVTKKKKSK